ncbi:transposase domain-containing protein [Stenotrophomonas sp. PS02298]|uniref:transposase domain-containing protein n=1 Tax=Stenotrophomonas sp. PS02298 TaxID=2991424 RepID=UPI00249BEF18|nr:transposase domain-containing protein [Stenotrophomonas sp. PS02298]
MPSKTSLKVASSQSVPTENEGMSIARWYSAAELAGLPGMPQTHSAVVRIAKRDVWESRRRPGKGGGREYAITSFPTATQAAILLRQQPVLVPVKTSKSTGYSEAQIAAAWQRYESAPQHLKEEAQRRMRALQAVELLVTEGRRLMDARAIVAAQLQIDNVRGASVASLGRWAALISPVEKQHRMAFLVSSYAGRTATADIPAEAWDAFKADYLRVEQPSANSCYERLERLAKVNGWALPSLKTFQRRIEAELPRGVLILARKGREAFDRTFPAQERDRSVFHALEAVNADGHKFDVFVRWPDGTIARPIMVGVQDLYAGKMLGYRIAETESADLARFAFRDVIQRYGIPEKVWLDNGRGFASKMLTGGIANRFRFKVKPDDPVGILTGLGCQIHWATPYHGQAKPIERAWRDFCDRISKHPAFAGAYTGNKPDAKPENYGSKAVPLEQFIRVVNEEVAAHNAREGRRTRVCGGQRSFDQVFNASYAQSTIRKASTEQLRQLLLATEVVTADQRDGSVRLSGNRYWCEAMSAHAGKKLMLRFDPEALHTNVEVYSLANVHIGTAECIAAVGFADTVSAKEHARARKQYRRAAQTQLDAERRMTAAQLAAQLPSPPPENLPSAGVVAPMFNKRAPTPATPQHQEPLQRTGTDDLHRDTSLSSFLEAQQVRQLRDSGWEPPESYP